MTKKNLLKTITTYFFRGILITVPLTITIYVIYRVFIFLDRLLEDVITFDIPGLGLITLIGVLTLIGILGSTILFQPLMNKANELLNRVPLVKTIYTAIADLVTAFVGTKKKFTRPVLVKMVSHSELHKLGFITEDDLEQFGIDNGKVAVYLPHSYAFSGNLYIVPKENVTPIDAKAADVMKFIVSGGVAQVSDRNEN